MMSEDPRPRRFALSDRRAIRGVVDDLPTAEPLLAHLDELAEHIAGRRGWSQRGARHEDLARAVRRVGALQWGELVVKPIRPGRVHDAQMIVLAVCIDRLVHPDKRYESRTGSADYNDRVRRRLLAWYWSTTFSGQVPTTAAAREALIPHLLEWCADRGPRPDTPTPPTGEWIAAASYRYGPRWRYDAVLALLGRHAPRDLLTGERLEVEQRFGKRLEGHHLFPQAWCQQHREIVPEDRVDSVVNIAPLTGYTNSWIKARAPREYLEGIRRVVGDEALHELLAGHLITPKYLEDHDFERFWTDRLARIRRLITTAVDLESPSESGY